jgi:hypothetical protein
MTRGDEAMTARFWLGSGVLVAPEPVPRRDRSDFGGPGDVGLNLRRTGRRSIADYGMDDFSTYLGEHDGKLVVAIKDFWTWQPTTCEIFDDLAELRQTWELD